jgi:hypothetical protein
MLERESGRELDGWPRLVLLGLLSLFWALAAGLILPSQLAAMAPGILPSGDVPRHWVYALGAAVPAALTAMAFGQRRFACGQSRGDWIRDCVVIGILASLGAIAGGALVFAVDFVLEILSGYRTEEWGGKPPWIGLPVTFVVMWVLAFWSSTLIAVIEGLLLTEVTTPLVLLLQRWACRNTGAANELVGGE